MECADQVLGREVQSSDQQKIGKVGDLLVDLESGRIVSAIISVNGSGLREGAIAVPAFALSATEKELRLDLNKQQLKNAPHFSKSAGRPGLLVSELIGSDVRNVSKQKLGQINNLMVDLAAGQVPFLIFSPDRSLGLKDNLYALPPNALMVSADGKSLTAGFDQEKLASAPPFPKDQWPNFSDRAWVSQVYQFYGKQPFFENGSLQPTSSRTNALERIYHEAKQE